MKPRLLLRKRFRKLIPNSKGFSSVIGTTFMVLVVMVLATSVFLRTLSQNTVYNEAVKEKNQLEVDRLNERVKAFYAVYAVTGNDVSVSAELQNQGSLSVQITNLWVVDVNTGNYNFSKSLSVNYLQPGGNATLTATVTIMGSASEHRFSSWLITGRGNVVPLEEKEVTEETITSANVTQGIGSMALDFETFGYFTYNTTTKLANYPTGNVSFNVPTNDYVAFRVRLTNLDPRKQNITLDSHSLFWQPGRGGIGEKSWFIVNVRDDGTIISIDKDTYSPITIPYTETITVIFASKNDLSFKSFDRLRTPTAETTVAIFLLLHGTIGTSPYAQNIPFVSIFYQSLS